MRSVVLDACVLYPAPLRDLLMSLGTHCPVSIHWTNQIHDEWIRNLSQNRPDLDERLLQRTKSLMEIAIPRAKITGFEDLIETLDLPDPDDRHVLAAAITAHVDTIVTWNIKDFPPRILKAHGIDRQTPDAFVVEILRDDQDLAIEAIRSMRSRLRNPPKSPEEFLAERESQGLTLTVSFLKRQSIIVRI